MYLNPKLENWLSEPGHKKNQNGTIKTTNSLNNRNNDAFFHYPSFNLGWVEGETPVMDDESEIRQE